MHVNRLINDMNVTLIQVNESEQLNETMRQSKKMEGGVGGVLVLGGTSPAPVSPAGANISIYEYKHVDTDNELNPIGANHVLSSRLRSRLSFTSLALIHCLPQVILVVDFKVDLSIQLPINHDTIIDS